MLWSSTEVEITPLKSDAIVFLCRLWITYSSMYSSILEFHLGEFNLAFKIIDDTSKNVSGHLRIDAEIHIQIAECTKWMD